MVPPPLAMPTPGFISLMHVTSRIVSTFIVHVLPKNPLTVLTAIKLSTFGLRAVGIWSRAKMEKQLR